MERLPPELQAKYPNSVEFNEKGFPRFEPYIHIDEEGRRYMVELDNITGDYRDNDNTNRAMGIVKEPKGITWHHVEDTRTMIGIPSDIHDPIKHTGGRAVKKAIRK